MAILLSLQTKLEFKTQDPVHPPPPRPLSFLASTASLLVAVMTYCGASWGRVERLGDGEEVACWRGLGWFFEVVVGMGWDVS